MNIGSTKKKIDKTKLNIGTELEFLVLEPNTLRIVNREQSQELFVYYAEKEGWDISRKAHNNEAQEAYKEFDGRQYVMKYDVSYGLFEFASPPVDSLSKLENMHATIIDSFITAVSEKGLIFWPLEVTPIASGLFNLPHQERFEIIDDQLYSIFQKQRNMTRICCIASHQVSLDIPVQKVIPTINALYKHLGEFIATFSTAPAIVDSKFYPSARYYWLNHSSPELDSDKYNYGVRTVFPPKEFESLTDYYFFIWKSKNVFVIREGVPYILPDKNLSMHDFIKAGKGEALNLDEKPVTVELQAEDVPLLLNAFWWEFKPHYDFDTSFTIEDFLEYYNKKDIDGFLQKYATHAWIEIRPCAPHFENNAMDISKYFYEIFSNIDDFIEESKSITWEQAKKERDRAVQPLEK